MSEIPLNRSPSYPTFNPFSSERLKPHRKVDVRPPGKGDSNSHGARPVHLIITMGKWIRTSRMSIKNSLSNLKPRRSRPKAPQDLHQEGAILDPSLVQSGTNHSTPNSPQAPDRWSATSYHCSKYYFTYSEFLLFTPKGDPYRGTSLRRAR